MSKNPDSAQVTPADGTPDTPDTQVASQFDEMMGTTPDPEELDETELDEDDDEVYDEADDEAQEEETEEGEPSEHLYKITVDGEEVEVTLEELQKGYSRQSDYTKKTQQLAQQRKEAAALQQAYAQRVQELNQFAQQIQQQPEIPEPAWTSDPQAWERLRHEDPVQFVLEKDAAKDRAQQRAHRAQQLQALQQEQAQIQQQQFAQHLSGQRQVLNELIPAWSNPETAKAEKKELRKWAAETYNLSEKDLSQAYDARLVKLLYDAWQANQSTSQAEKKLKRSPESTVRTAPKRGRNTTPSDTGASRLKKSMQSLKKTGKNADAVAVFDALLK